MMRVQHAIRDGTSGRRARTKHAAFALLSEFLFPRPRFPQYPYSHILDYAVSHTQLYTVVYRPPHMRMDHSVRSESLLYGAATYSHPVRVSHTRDHCTLCAGLCGRSWGVLQRSPHLSHSLPFTHGSTGPLPSHIRTFRESSALHRTDSSRTLPSFDDDDLAWDG